MSRNDSEIERWHFGDRYYGITLASTPGTMTLELDDLGPAQGRGLIMVASQNDNTGEISIQVFSDAPLPMGLVEEFVSEVRRRLPPHA